MDKKPPEQPGAPPSEPIKPNPVNENKPSFAFEELTLEIAEEIDGVHYLTFIVGDRYLISVEKWEYFAYLDYIFTMRAKAVVNGISCRCDVCNPQFEEIKDADLRLKKVKIDFENETEEEIEDRSIIMFACFNLVENTLVSFHAEEEENFEKP